MADASNGSYNDKYSTYRLTDVPSCPEHHEMMVSIEKESESRFLSGIAPLGPERVEVPI